MGGVDRSFWTPRPIAPIPTLAHLRDQVLLHSQKRCPKWKFRLAPDLVTQLQPRPVVLISEVARAYEYRQHRVEFDGRAYFGADLSADLFTVHGALAGVPHIYFQLYNEAESPETWWIKPTRASTAQRDPETRRLVPVDLDANIEHLVSRLTPATFAVLNDTLLLSPHCLICGKGLTDAASRARCIGPECANTASLEVPGLFQLDTGYLEARG